MIGSLTKNGVSFEGDGNKCFHDACAELRTVLEKRGMASQQFVLHFDEMQHWEVESHWGRPLDRTSKTVGKEDFSKYRLIALSYLLPTLNVTRLFIPAISGTSRGSSALPIASNVKVHPLWMPVFPPECVKMVVERQLLPTGVREYILSNSDLMHKLSGTPRVLEFFFRSLPMDLVLTQPAQVIVQDAIVAAQSTFQNYMKRSLKESKAPVSWPEIVCQAYIMYIYPQLLGGKVSTHLGQSCIEISSHSVPTDWLYTATAGVPRMVEKDSGMVIVYPPYPFLVSFMQAEVQAKGAAILIDLIQSHYKVKVSTNANMGKGLAFQLSVLMELGVVDSPLWLELANLAGIFPAVNKSTTVIFKPQYSQDVRDAVISGSATFNVHDDPAAGDRWIDLAHPCTFADGRRGDLVVECKNVTEVAKLRSATLEFFKKADSCLPPFEGSQSTVYAVFSYHKLDIFQAKQKPGQLEVQQIKDLMAKHKGHFVILTGIATLPTKLPIQRLAGTHYDVPWSEIVRDFWQYALPSNKRSNE